MKLEQELIKLTEDAINLSIRIRVNKALNNIMERAKHCNAIEGEFTEVSQQPRLASAQH